MEIPVIDFAKYGLDADEQNYGDSTCTADAIVRALATSGFVYLKNTGIQSEELERVNRTMKEFCQLDSVTKKLFEVDYSKTHHGYCPPFNEGSNPERPPDVKEAFSSLVGGPEPQPTLEWPDEYVPGFSAAWKDLNEIFCKLSFRILDLLSIGLKMKDKSYMRRSHSRMGDRGNLSTLRAMHYPGISDDAKIRQGQARIGEHSDFGIITLLFQDEVGGLEVEDLEGNFVPVKPIPGTIVMNAGDSLQYWTKGRLKAARHRVVIPEGDNRKTSRQSIAFFVHADDEIELSALEFEEEVFENSLTFGDEQYKKIYTSKEYLEMKLREMQY